ncbi:hypothetical protein [Roseovarius aestuariivivens]|uniref:hypothetical protein n=1 Tax=Roseovarius aestuariivivens TaxID=1888910 RepID=UPI001080C333|nr:hypothetical protein [Roseovarius aestuariivivens]
MTALKQYQRLEAAGLWRPSPDAQRVNVVVSIGDATLTICDLRDRPLTHWSLAAIERSNPGQRPAIYHPDGDMQETLELAADESAMIDAIEKLRRAIERGRPRPGRLRLTMLGLSFAVLAAVMTVWMPDALRGHAASVLPDVKRIEIGENLRREIETVTGPLCTTPAGEIALGRLASRLPGPEGPARIAVLRSGARQSVALPGGTILVNRTLIEDFDEPDVLAGFVVAAHLRASLRDPLNRLLGDSSLWDVAQLLTTGVLPQEVLQAHARALLTAVEPPIPDETLLDAFRRWAVRSRPYAYAVDVTGETTLGLIEADPFARDIPPPLLSDADWLQLQGICTR